MKGKLFMIKRFPFSLIKPKITLCGVSDGTLRGLDKKMGLVPVKESRDCIRRR